VAGGRAAAGLSHVVGLQQLLDGQAVAAPAVVHEQAVRHQSKLRVGLRRGRNVVIDMNHRHGHVLGGRRLVVMDGRVAIAAVVVAVHALYSLVVRGKTGDNRVAGQRVSVILSRILLVPPPLNCVTEVPETHKTSMV